MATCQSIPKVSSECWQVKSEQIEAEIEKIAEDYQTTMKQKPQYSSLISSIFYMIVFIFLGLPIWYRTTTPERCQLPDISWLMVRSQTLTHYYKISVVFLESSSALNKTSFKTYLQTNHGRRISLDQSVSFTNEWSVRFAFNNEQQIAATESKNFDTWFNEIDHKLSADNVGKSSSIMFYVLPKNVHTNQLINVGRYRSFYIDLNHLPECKNQVDELIVCLGDRINDQVQKVQGLVENFYSNQLGHHEQNTLLLMARDFDFIFDIIYEEDEILTSIDLDQRHVRHLETLDKIDQLLANFYTHRFNFSRYFRINFITQVLHFVFPNENFVNSRLTTNVSSNQERLLPLSSIESILNRLESSRMEHDNEKSYHMVLYITSKTFGPMKFYNELHQSKTNLVTTPFRGSVLMVNDLQDVHTGFTNLIRSFFFNLPPCPILSNSDQQEFFTQLEIESIVHALVQKHIMETLNSLESIAKLLKTVNNMVIEQKIANRIEESLESAMKASQMLMSSGDIGSAYEHSWNAYWQSEKAFYDPSLLSLLYFPDDQKYAIYLPLFLPICIPLLHNLRYLINSLINRKKYRYTIGQTQLMDFS